MEEEKEAAEEEGEVERRNDQRKGLVRILGVCLGCRV